MIETLALRETLGAQAGASSSALSDPIPLKGNDRASVISILEYLYGTTPSVSYTTEVSNDGVTWVSGGATVVLSAADVPDLEVFALNGVLVRVRMTLDASLSGVDAGTLLNLQIKLDRISPCRSGCGRSSGAAAATPRAIGATSADFRGKFVDSFPTASHEGDTIIPHGGPAVTSAGAVVASAGPVGAISPFTRRPLGPIAYQFADTTPLGFRLGYYSDPRTGQLYYGAPMGLGGPGALTREQVLGGTTDPYQSDVLGPRDVTAPIPGYVAPQPASALLSEAQRMLQDQVGYGTTGYHASPASILDAAREAGP